MKKVLAITVLVSFFLVAGSAMAWTTVDFTDNYYQQADGDQSFYSDQDDLTIYASGYDAHFTWTHQDGLGGGGASYEDDEWELGQIGDYMAIQFDYSVQLTEIYLTDFFYEERDNHWYEEIGLIEFFYDNGSSGVLEFSQTDHNIVPSGTNGEYTIDVASLVGEGQLIRGVYLAGLGYQTWNDSVREDHEFAVAGLAAVPEPSTVILLGLGLTGLALVGRKKRLSKK